MTKPELYNKHPELFTAESAALMADLANHMRRGATTVGPKFPPNAILDGIAVARRMEFTEGWLAASEYIQQLHIKPAELTPQQPREHYVNPNPQQQ